MHQFGLPHEEWFLKQCHITKLWKAMNAMRDPKKSLQKHCPFQNVLWERALFSDRNFKYGIFILLCDSREKSKWNKMLHLHVLVHPEETIAFEIINCVVQSKNKCSPALFKHNETRWSSWRQAYKDKAIAINALFLTQ